MSSSSDWSDILFDADELGLFLAFSTDFRVLVPLADMGDPAVVGPAFAKFASAGLVEVSAGDAPAATLTPFAAARLGLSVAETSDGYRWAAAPSGASLRARPRRRETTELDELADPRALTPDEIAEARETVTAASGDVLDRLDNLQRPWILLAGCRPWYGHGRSDYAPKPKHCPACLGKPLRPTVYCLVCYRWGLDPLRNRLFASLRARLDTAKRKRPRPTFKPSGKAS